MNFDTIPNELKACNQWLIWRTELTTTGRQTKIPYNCKTGFMASVTDPATWSDWYTANAALAASGYNGLGFVFSKDDPYFGLDLDHTTDTNRIEFQNEVYRQFSPTYAEFSPSGKGLHFIGRGAVPTGKRRDAIELYSQERFFTVTGNVHLPNPIVDLQPQVTWLWNELGGAVHQPQSFEGTYEEVDTDQTILDRAANAVNGDRFLRLWNGDWQDEYPSQSEADFALVDMLAFYSPSVFQVARLFRLSALGKRDKSNRDAYVMGMVRRAYDRHPAPMDVAAIRANLDAALGRPSAPPAPAEDAETVPLPEPFTATDKNPYLHPVPGLLGQIAYYVYQSSPRPVPEVSLAAAIGLMAGICGRGWNISGTGLNQYIMLLAGTGRGKEAVHTGIRNIMTKVADIGPGGGGCPAAMEFLGPDDIASGQALVKYMSKTSKSFITVQGEFDLTLKSFVSRNANAALLKLKQILLKSYSRSGRGKVLEGTIYSDSDKNTAPITSPAFSLIGEGTPERLYSMLDEALVQDGLLPRFTIIHYEGDRVPLHKAHMDVEPPAGLIRSIAALCGQSLMLNQSNQVIDVGMTAEAEALTDTFDRKIDGTINQANNEIIAQLWNRAHLKVLKLAAIIAVGINSSQPVVSAEVAQYAIDIVGYDTRRLVAKFESGDVGDSESKQANDVKRLIRKYCKAEPREANKYSSTRSMIADKVIPKRFLQMRTSNVTAFRNDRVGATNALNRVLNSFIDAGVIQQLGPVDTRKYASQNTKLYTVLDADWLKVERSDE